MPSFGSFIRTATTRQKPIPRFTTRSFTATTQNKRFELPQFKTPPPIMTTTTLKGQPLDRPALDSMLRRRMFYTPSFEIYGGVAGLYDYGPVGCIFLSPFPFSSQQLVGTSLWIFGRDSNMMDSFLLSMP